MKSIINIGSKDYGTLRNPYMMVTREIAEIEISRNMEISKRLNQIDKVLMADFYSRSAGLSLAIALDDLDRKYRYN